MSQCSRREAEGEKKKERSSRREAVSQSSRREAGEKQKKTIKESWIGDQFHTLNSNSMSVYLRRVISPWY